MSAKGNYGIDSPAIVATLFTLGIVGSVLGFILPHFSKWIAYGFGVYFLLGAAGMLFYSKVGKLALCERILDGISWRGDERVLDVGCGRGLLTVAAAHRLCSGKVVGMDVWLPSAITGDQSNSVLQNAQIEQLSDRVQIQKGDARDLPFPDSVFDAVVSNFVVHELRTPEERRQMMREIARVLKPGGHVALADFIFTSECVADLKMQGVNAVRRRDSPFSFWISAVSISAPSRRITWLERKASALAIS